MSTFVTPEQIAVTARVSLRTVQRSIRNGSLPSHILDSRRVIYQEDAETYVLKRTAIRSIEEALCRPLA
jgi:hypothetical protein